MSIEDYRKIISMAIGNEVSAYEFYTAISEKTQDANLKKIFADMAREEKGHKAYLEGFLSGQKPLKFAAATDYKISETLDKPKLSVSMKPADGIALAMKEEEAAMQMYQSLAASSSTPEQKDLFASLAEMEKGHKAKLEDLYTSMAYAEVW